MRLRRRSRAPRIGLALGGGGARGLAHIPLLEALDGEGLRPHLIAGTSIGAIIGAFYASGHSGREIRDLVHNLVSLEWPAWKHLFSVRNTTKWYELLSPSLGGNGLVDTQRFLDFIEKRLGCTEFEALDIPLKVVATDFWGRKPVIFESGALIPALQASMALPGIFAPVVLGGRVLIDGGAVSPVPYDLLRDQCDISIAVNVLGTRVADESDVPGFMEAIFGTFQIMEETILTEKMRPDGPDIYVKFPIRNVRVLEFHKAAEVYAQAEPSVREFRRQLQAIRARV